MREACLHIGKPEKNANNDRGMHGFSQGMQKEVHRYGIG